MQEPLPIKTLVVLLALFGCVLALVAYRYDAKLKGERLEMAIARIPTGITAAEADRMIGSAPDKISQSSCVIAVHGTVYAASNPKAAAYGKPQTYEFRVWRRGPVTASVVVGPDGKVAARSTWK
jgi:hypothetical protein